MTCRTPTHEIVTGFMLVARPLGFEGPFWRTHAVCRQTGKVCQLAWCSGTIEQAQAQHDMISCECGLSVGMFSASYLIETT